ncbi:hypothetical protein GR702_15920 [Novosphingobium sp. FGD1]|uniref:Uncharacterized protein n=1 Tax=Novosphingobium silvae TaxID=2692619 RepID=A0A7X4GIG4_9SPHN|nr:hypothetical protein [Novosphingobium silvae]
MTVLSALLLFLAAAPATASTDAPSPPPSPVSLRLKAAEARQGAASDGKFLYAIDNDRIGKYRIATGEKVAEWQGERRLYPHMNSCTVVGTQLVCAASNYPQVPQTSSVEVFDTGTLKHVRSVSLGFGPGSLTVMDRHDGKWWAVFANYEGKGGEPGRDYRYTVLVRMDDAFRAEASWAFPEAVLARMAPKSCSGLSWSEDGLIYATGHDRPELYAMRLPEAGSRLELVETIGLATPGQAIDWDPLVQRRLWSIGRGANEVVASQIPPVQ